jgi:N-acetylmuramoyl-L-alanine amidase
MGLRLEAWGGAPLAMIKVGVALTLLLPSPLLAQKTTTRPATLAAVQTVTRTALPKGERITIEFSSEVGYRSDRVDGPDRVYFDFPQSLVTSSVVNTAQALTGGTLVRTLRIARHTERSTRLVLELAGRPRYSVFTLYNPFRLVIDVEAETAVTAASSPLPIVASVSVSTPDEPSAPPAASAAPPPPPPLPAPVRTAAPLRDHTKEVPIAAPPPASALARGDYSLARQLGLGVSRIVIDAGHGGHDPGAQSNGINESELVLDVALRLEQLLADQPGIDVVLTRRTDEFIPLEERTAIANREHADLFLSIHANASRQPAARGIETYFLNFATNPAAEAVAARENATSAKTMGTLPELVKTIALNNKVKESRELATIVQTSMARRLQTQNKTLRDLGVKQAPFVVLIGAQMPSVLAEISFVTNKSEAALLKQSTYRQRIAQALFDAVSKYQDSLKKVTTVALKDAR